MARAKGLLLLLAAARSMTSHAADFGAPATASMSYSTYAAASRALSAASGATAASSTAYAAASGAPTIASRLLGSPAAPVGGGGNRYTLGIGALAAFAAAAVMLTTDPMPEWYLVPEHHDAQNQVDEVERIEDGSEMEDAILKDQVVDSILGMEKDLTRAPSARELRRMRAKMQKNDKFWKYLEDAIKKAKIVLAAVGVAKEVYALILSTITGSILLIEKYGDPVHYFVCPYSGYAEVTGIFLFSVIPKDKTQQGESSSGGPALQVKCCSDTITMSLSRCEVYGKTISSFLPKDHYHRKADYIEFIAATLHLNKLEREEHLVAAFSYFDKDGSCYITVDELQQACQEHNMPYSFLDDVIEEADQDSDGRIDSGEFVAMMTKGNMGVGRRTMRNSLNISMRDAPGAL